MNKKEIKTYPELAKAIVHSIAGRLDYTFEYCRHHNNHFMYSMNPDCSVHAFEDSQSFTFSMRSRGLEVHQKVLTVLTELYPFDTKLYESTLRTLSNLYQTLSFTVEPVKTKNIENFSWLSFCPSKNNKKERYWEDFNHFNYEFKLYPWNKKVINLSVSQLIKMIIVDDNGTKKYIPVMETSLPLNENKRTKICISLNKEDANIYVLSKTGEYEIETLDNIVKMVNKGIRNYIFNILYQRHQIEISKSDFAILELDKYLKYVTLNEMAEI
jgi:hypothetical protein